MNVLKNTNKTEQVISLKFFWLLTRVEKKEIANFLIDRKIDQEVIKQEKFASKFNARFGDVKYPNNNIKLKK